MCSVASRWLLCLTAVFGLALPGVAQTPVPPAPQTASAQPQFDANYFEGQALRIIGQMQRPDFDFQQFRDQMRQLMQEFRDATQGMDPQQAEQFRQKLMDRLQPAIQANMPMIVMRMQQGFLDGLKKELECTDEEFAAIRPFIEKVINQMRALGLNTPGGRGRFGGVTFNAPAASEATAAFQRARQELETALADKYAPIGTIHFHVDALRTARTKAMLELDAARNELRGLLTVRQEAILVQAGILE